MTCGKRIDFKQRLQTRFDAACRMTHLSALLERLTGFLEGMLFGMSHGRREGSFLTKFSSGTITRSLKWLNFGGGKSITSGPFEASP